jgi:hypothetical protein
MWFAADYSETLEVFLLTSVDLDVGSLDSTENVQNVSKSHPTQRVRSCTVAISQTTD